MISKRFDKENYTFKINGKDLDFSDSRKITIIKEANCIDTIEVELVLDEQQLKVDSMARLYFILGDKKYIVIDVEDIKKCNEASK
jgi:hypothetical protein